MRIRYLGPDIGFANVMAYNDADGSCELSMVELASICQQFFNECMSFLESRRTNHSVILCSLGTR